MSQSCIQLAWAGALRHRVDDALPSVYIDGVYVIWYGPTHPKPRAIGSTYAALASHFQTSIKFSLVFVIISHRQWHRCLVVHTTHLRTPCHRLHICWVCKLSIGDLLLVNISNCSFSAPARRCVAHSPHTSEMSGSPARRQVTHSTLYWHLIGEGPSLCQTSWKGCLLHFQRSLISRAGGQGIALRGPYILGKNRDAVQGDLTCELVVSD